MVLAALRRAFRARPGTSGCYEFMSFLTGLDESECSWPHLVAILETDVIPVVSRHHPAVDADEIASTCLAGVFESWASEWLDRIRSSRLVRQLLAEERIDDAFEALANHPRFVGRRAECARKLWLSLQYHAALELLEGSQSARNHFIAKTRAQVSETQRKQRRQSVLLSRNCLDRAGLPAPTGRHSRATPSMRSLCGAELDDTRGEGNTWCISALPPAQLLSQDLTVRIRRMLCAIEALGPDHERVFKLLLEGLSQKKIAKVEGRHPAAISRRVHDLRELCRGELLG
jgi:DNA-directed RNA polymerase specialized sigma24 family protein